MRSNFEGWLRPLGREPAAFWEDYDLWAVDEEVLESWIPPGVPYLGHGSARIVVGLCPSHVLKVDVETDSPQTREEAALWAVAGTRIRAHMAPVVEYGRSAEVGWTLMGRCQPLSPYTDRFGEEVEGVSTQLGDVVVDLMRTNVGIYEGRLVVLDYGMLSVARADKILAEHARQLAASTRVMAVA